MRELGLVWQGGAQSLKEERKWKGLEGKQEGRQVSAESGGLGLAVQWVRQVLGGAGAATRTLPVGWWAEEGRSQPVSRWSRWVAAECRRRVTRGQ